MRPFDYCFVPLHTSLARQLETLKVQDSSTRTRVIHASPQQTVELPVLRRCPLAPEILLVVTAHSTS